MPRYQERRKTRVTRDRNENFQEEAPSELGQTAEYLHALNESARYVIRIKILI